MCVDFLCQCSMYDKIIQYMQRYLIPYFLQCFEAVGCREATPVHKFYPRGFGGRKFHPRGPGAPRG